MLHILVLSLRISRPISSRSLGFQSTKAARIVEKASAIVRAQISDGNSLDYDNLYSRNDREDAHSN